MTEVPEVWLRFGSCIYQDFFGIHPEFHEGILFALEGLNSSEKYELMSFVEHTLCENHRNQYLVDLWVESGASDVLVSDQMKAVYEALLQALEESVRLKS
ncbi:hypothetical protein [Microbulbifer agarilyticus]